MIDINELRDRAATFGSDYLTDEEWVEVIDRLEAAEKSDAESIAMYRKARDERDALRAAVRHEADCVEAAMAEIKSLRAKIAAMERQEPVVWMQSAHLSSFKNRLCGSQSSYVHCSDHQLHPDFKPLYALPGAQKVPSVPVEQDGAARKAWARFSNELNRSPDAPYPGMSEAFEQHFSQSFTDRDWRAESGTWAAAWKAAKRHGAQPAQSVPDGWKQIPEKHPTFDLVDLRLADGSVLCGCVPQSDGDYWWEGPSGEVFIDPKYAPATHWRLAAAPEAKP